VIPKEALDYIKNKKLRPAFSYRDVWNEEHATNFTVAKAMQIDVLGDIKQAVEKAIEDGLPFEQFKTQITPTLQAKGWWGKKEMVDPVTGETVNAQLGSDRRLKTIYDTNTRSAYQEGRWERSQESAAHPYLMYRVGPSQHHRQEHLSWDGLVLPKDDPWWNSHYPPNGWGCKCWTMAESEARKERLEKSGITVPPTHDGQPGYTVPVKTQAPPTRYKTWVDNRTGRIEKIPMGISPGFNWNQGRMGRDIPLFDDFMKKGKDGFHPDIEAVARTILTSQIKRDEFVSFIGQSQKRDAVGSKATAVGFVENKVASWLKKNEGMEIGDSVTIALEARLLNGPKAVRHGKAGDAIGAGALTVLDALIYGRVYFDEGNLIYLFAHSAGRYSKITVNPRLKRGGRGSELLGPGVVNIESIGASINDGEYRRIIEDLKQIK
jgi:hypothetical protein